MKLSDCSYFAGDSLLHPEAPYVPQGVSGVPAHDTLAGGDIVVGALLLCVVMTALAVSHSRHFIVRQIKELFYTGRRSDNDATETAPEVRAQLCIVLGTCLQLAVFAWFYAVRYIGGDYRLPSPYWLIAIFAGLTLAYYIVKAVLYLAVNATFFGRRAAAAWSRSLLFLTSVEGVLTLPAVLVMTCFDVSLRTMTIYILGVLALVRLMTLYKAKIIFFRRFGLFLQNFLYFCTLEIVPLLALWAVMTAVATQLRITI